MNRYTMILLAAVVAVLAAAPKSTWADTLFSNFGTTMAPTRRIGFCVRPKTLQPSNNQGSQTSLTTPYTTPTGPTNFGNFGNSNADNHSQPNNLIVNHDSSSTWFPQSNNTSGSFGDSNVNNHSQPNNLPVNDDSGSTWFPQSNNTRVVSNPHCPPITATPEWGSTLLFLGVDLAGFMTLASLTGILRRRRILAA
jgi:hypothetical protein